MSGMWGNGGRGRGPSGQDRVAVFSGVAIIVAVILANVAFALLRPAAAPAPVTEAATTSAEQAGVPATAPATEDGSRAGANASTPAATTDSPAARYDALMEQRAADSFAAATTGPALSASDVDVSKVSVPTNLPEGVSDADVRSAVATYLAQIGSRGLSDCKVTDTWTSADGELMTWNLRGTDAESGKSVWFALGWSRTDFAKSHALYVSAA